MKLPLTARIFTFYSFKGGVGRSMALLNCAYVLAGIGRREPKDGPADRRAWSDLALAIAEDAIESQQDLGIFSAAAGIVAVDPYLGGRAPVGAGIRLDQQGVGRAGVPVEALPKGEVRGAAQQLGQRR